MEECNEYQNLLKRNGAPYSRGHQIQYLAPIQMMEGGKWDVLEIGFGIGYGLEEMAKAGVLNLWYGVEPCNDSFQHVWNKFNDRPAFALAMEKRPWSECVKTTSEVFHFAFCIEVIEHIPMDEHVSFLSSIVPFVRKNLFLSTPDKSKNSHGVRTEKEWLDVLDQAGWRAVAWATCWTTGYICQPK